MQTAASTTPDARGSLLPSLEEAKQFKVLLEAPYRHQHLKNSVLLTVDLTKAVADEAISRGDTVIIAYRLFSTTYFMQITVNNKVQIQSSSEA